MSSGSSRAVRGDRQDARNARIRNREGEEDDSPNAPRQDGHVEVDNKCKRKPGRLEVGKRLGEVHRRKLVDGLELDDQLLCHEKFRAHLAREPVLIGHGERRLTNKR
ncbi:MAG TPA: hypothetical protein VK841_16400, partial [Polyangiaceae bacterium]|nr:hypothetical protein [Polyangiaceae bacterium]